MSQTTHSPAKVRAFFDEFPFLKNYINWKAVDSSMVGRVDSELLTERAIRNESPAIFTMLGSHPSVPMNIRIFLLDKEGNLLYKVGAWKNANYRWWKLWTVSRLQNETVGDALHCLGERAKDVHYVLWIHDWFTVELVLYKPPKDFTIQEWLNTQLEAEKSKIRKDLADLDKPQ